MTPDYILHELGYAEGLMYMLAEMIRHGGKFGWEGELSEQERRLEKMRALVRGDREPGEEEEEDLTPNFLMYER